MSEVAVLGRTVLGQSVLQIPQGYVILPARFQWQYQTKTVSHWLFYRNPIIKVNHQFGSKWPERLYDRYLQLLDQLELKRVPLYRVTFKEEGTHLKAKDIDGVTVPYGISIKDAGFMTYQVIASHCNTADGNHVQDYLGIAYGIEELEAKVKWGMSLRKRGFDLMRKRHALSYKEARILHTENPLIKASSDAERRIPSECGSTREGRLGL